MGERVSSRKYGLHIAVGKTDCTVPRSGVSRMNTVLFPKVLLLNVVAYNMRRTIYFSPNSCGHCFSQLRKIHVNEWKNSTQMRQSIIREVD